MSSSSSSVLRRRRISQARRREKVRGSSSSSSSRANSQRLIGGHVVRGDVDAFETGPREYKRILVVHEARFMSPVQRDVVVNPECFEGLKRNDVIEIIASDDPARRVVLQVTSLQPVKGNLQISLRKRIADLFDLRNRSEVIVRVLDPQSIVVDFIELSFNDQYISRGDMWRFKKALIGSCVYYTQTVTALGVIARINEMLVNGEVVNCGLISPQTKFIFRSSSARVMWMIQLSDEMWDYADDGELHYEKVVNGLLKALFERWQELKVNHALSVVLFARTFFDKDQEQSSNWDADVSNRSISAAASNVFQTDHQERLYQDFYKLVVDSEIRKDWASLRTLLKKEINDFSQHLRWGVCDEETGLKGVPSTAVEGNVLEAINLALNVYDKHYIDRDLKRTGQSVVVLTAGTGVWVVDRSLIELTKERMVDNGVGCDLISVARPPLHTVPLFVYKPSRSSSVSPASQGSADSGYCIADDWIDMKYFRQEDTSGEILCSSQQNVVSKMRNESTFVPIPWCRMFPDLETIPGRIRSITPSEDLRRKSCESFQASEAEARSAFSSSPIAPADVVVPYHPTKARRSSLKNASFVDYDSHDVAVFSDAPLDPAKSPSTGVRHSGSFPSLERLLAVSSTTSVSPLPRSDAFHRRMSASTSQSPPPSTRDADVLTLDGASHELSPSSVSLEPDSSVALSRASAEDPGTGVGFCDRRQSAFRYVVDPQSAPRSASPGMDIGSSSSSVPHSSRLSRSFERGHLFDRNKRWYAKRSIDIGDSMTLQKVRIARPSTSVDDDVDPLSSAVFSKRSQKMFRVKPKSRSLVSVLVESTVMDSSDSISSSASLRPKMERDHVFNPFRMHIPVPKMASNRRRWVHLFPVHAAQVKSGSQTRLNMRSLCMPAVLPLTTDYFPGTDELQKSFMSNVTTLSLIPNENKYENRVDYLLSELITQRLTQDFQLNVRTKVSKKATSAQGKQSRMLYQLTLGTENHQIELDRDSGNIEVQRYIRRSSSRSSSWQALFPYRYFLWSDHANGVVPVDVMIASHHVEFNWNYQDQLTAGYHDEFINGLKHRRLRFAIVPPTTHPEKDGCDLDGRLSLFTEFMESLTGQAFDRLGIVAKRSDRRSSNRSSRCGSVDHSDMLADKPESSTATGFGLVGVGVRSCRIELQSIHRDRHEWFQLQYDTVFDPSTCFHMEVQWLVATGLQIDGWLTKCRQRAKDCGLSLIQIPTDQPLRTSDPFHVSLLIPINSRAESELAQSYLLSTFDFVLDSNYSSWRKQYMHRSGMAIIRVLRDGLLWVNNNLMSSAAQRQMSIEVYRQFRTFCSTLSDTRELVLNIASSAIDLHSDGLSF